MTIKKRLETLERELKKANRRNYWLLIAVLVGVSIIGLTPAKAQTDQPALKEIWANKYILVDEAGKVRATLSASRSWPGLWLYDESGKVLWSAPQ